MNRFRLHRCLAIFAAALILVIGDAHTNGLSAGISSGGVLGTTTPLAPGVAHVTVDARTSFQTMTGFGVSERVFDDPHLFNNFNPITQRAQTEVPRAAQDAILDKLFKDLNLTRIRPTTEAAVEPLPHGQFTFDWKRNDAHIDIVKRVLRRGATTYFLSPLKLESWMSTHGSHAVTDYVDWAMTILRRWRAQGLDVPYYSVVNEPGNPALGMSGEFIRDVIKVMGPKLRTEGFNTRFVITDDINPSEALRRSQIILADREARRYVGALASHLYGASDGKSATSMAPMRELSKRYTLPLWMTEYSRGETKTSSVDWAALMQDLIVNENVSAIDYMWGYFGQWQAGFTLLSINAEGARYTGYTLDPAFYTVGQFSRFIRPGMRRIRSHSADAAVKVAAFRKGRAPTIVVINTGQVSRRVRIQIIGLPPNNIFSPIQTTEAGDENWMHLRSLPSHGTSVTVTLPRRSVTTFVDRL